MIDSIRHGASRTLVIRGEAGVGKSSLLEYVIGQASGCRVVRAAGVQAEAELAFAGLHQLCAPLLDRLERIPAPQRDALGTAFGLRAGPAPDRFLLALAVLSLLAETAADRPLVCVIDDAQWLDRTSAQVLPFVARRLVAESVALIFGLRDSAEEHSFAGLPQMVLGGLSHQDARELLATAIPGPLDERVRDRIVAETRGNPLALLELPKGLTYAELAGGFGLLNAESLAGRIEDSFRRRLASLPPDPRRLLLVAAAEPVGDPALVRRAAQQLDLAVDAVHPADLAGLVQFGERVTFRHPLVRSAIYGQASLQERREAHRALAEVTEPAVDADRRAWHLAQATSDPDEDVAAELERVAGLAQARGGLAAAAAFLERATRLTPDPARRTQRALAAAQAKLQVGAFDSTLALLAIAEEGPRDAVQEARVDLMRAQVAYAQNPGDAAPRLLLRAARQLEPLDLTLARDTYLEALSAAQFAGRMVEGGLVATAEAARSAQRPAASGRATDVLLDGMAVLITEGYRPAAPLLRQALATFVGGEVSTDDTFRWGWLACRTAIELWDYDSWREVADRIAELARDTGALAVLPIGLTLQMGTRIYAGDLDSVVALEDELDAIIDATGIQLAPYGALLQSAWRGRHAEASAFIDAAIDGARSRGEGMGVSAALLARALLYNGLGRHDDALAAAEGGSAYPEDLAYFNLSLVELVEAAAHCRRRERAIEAVERLAASTSSSGTDWALGIEARCRAMVSDGDDAERLHREAILRLGRTRVRVELARAHLLYGEWLRRERRRLQAREQLRAAHEMFTAMGIDAFADRARRELAATGETARKRTVATRSQLTAREAQIVRMARDGLSNPEIGSRLFLSPRTVEYHLGNVFAKLGITSRHELDRVATTHQ